MICPICGNTKKNSKLPSYLYKYFLCGECQGSYLKETSKPIYKKVYFKQNSSPSIIFKITRPLLDIFTNFKIHNIIKTAGGKKAIILDYGCGSGKLVRLLNSVGVKTIGFEPSKGAIELTTKEKLPVYQRLIKQKKGYNLIMFWHSLEHDDHPLSTLLSLKKHLTKNKSKLLIAVPNGDSFEARIGQDKWFHLTYPLHRIQFTPDSIRLMLSKAGFKDIRIDFFNPEYTVSGLVQTALNFFLPKDTLYSVVSHRRIDQSLFRAKIFAVISILLVIFFSPLLLLFFIFQLIFKKTGAMVVTAIY